MTAVPPQASLATPPPAVSYMLLGAGGEPMRAHEEHREFYAASTVKLAVAVALMRGVDRGQLSLDDTIPCTDTFLSRVAGAPAFSVGPDERDPGMPEVGTAVTLGWCLERMVVVSSNEATNLLAEVLGLDAVNGAAAWLGASDVSMTRLICDYAASEAGFTHTATARGLATLMWQLVCGTLLSDASRAHLRDILQTQQFPIIAGGLPAHTRWGSKSGWDDGIRHDVAFVGTPGHADFRVLAVCTEGFTPRGAQEVIVQLARAIHPVATPATAPATETAK